MSLSKKKRFEVFKRDKFTCQYCGRRPPDVVLECDHIVPKAEGGPDTMENLTTSCFACNRGKKDIPLDDVAPALSEEEVLESIQEMLERKMNLKKSLVVAEAKREAEQDAIDTVERWWCEQIGEGTRFERASIKRFLQHLSPQEIAKAIDITEGFWSEYPWKTEAAVWKYFCGVCWKIAKDKHGWEDGEG